jgi:hypothetical protein
VSLSPPDEKKVNDCIAAVCRPANCSDVLVLGPCVALSRNEVRDWLAGSRCPAVHRKDQLIRGKNVPTEEKWPIDPKKQKKHNREILKKLNSHDAETLMSLQGIGPKMACMIMACCFMRGEAFRFESIQDLRKVPGLGEAFFKKHATKPTSFVSNLRYCVFAVHIQHSFICRPSDSTEG